MTNRVYRLFNVKYIQKGLTKSMRVPAYNALHAHKEFNSYMLALGVFDTMIIDIIG